MHYVNFMEIVEFTSSKVDRLLFNKNVLHRRFGAHRSERVDPSSRVDLLRYQEDRTLEEDACNGIPVGYRGFYFQPSFIFI